jgi:hypothetical protein
LILLHGVKLLNTLLNLYDFGMEITYSVEGLGDGLGRRNSNAGKGKRFFLLPNIQTVSEAYAAPHSVHTWALSWGIKRLTNHRHVVPRLRMSGAISLLHQYFMA